MNVVGILELSKINAYIVFGNLSQLLVAYEADQSETKYYYGAEGLTAQYNTGSKKYFASDYKDTMSV